jgi:hypothetical protein
MNTTNRLLRPGRVEMPRIRTLKPEAFQHRKVGALPDRHFRLWIGGISHADDEGRLVADARQLRMLIFGYHLRVTETHVNAILRELDELGLIKLYTVNGTRYLCYPSWHDHQKISKPTASRLPPPPSVGDSSTAPRPLREESGSTPRGLPLDLIEPDLINPDLKGGRDPGGRGGDGDRSLFQGGTERAPATAAVTENQPGGEEFEQRVGEKVAAGMEYPAAMNVVLGEIIAAKRAGMPTPEAR